VRTGIHVGVDVLAEKLEGNARRIITTIAMSGGVIFTAILTWIGSDFVWHVRASGPTSPDLEIQMWIIYLAVPLGSALMCFRFVQALMIFLKTGEVAHHDHGAVDGLEDETPDLSKGERP
jgi:C4-dicarboxylate transporter, DctQ subunit